MWCQAASYSLQSSCIPLWCALVSMGGIQHNQATMLTRENCKGSDLAGFEYFSGWPLHFAKDIFHLYAAAQLGVGGGDYHLGGSWQDPASINVRKVEESAYQRRSLGPCLSQEANFWGFVGKKLAEKEEITTMPALLLVVKQHSRRGNYYYWWYSY